MSMDKRIFETYESEVRSYCRKFPAVFKSAKNAIIRDEDGNEYIDFLCGAGSVNYGHNNDYIKNKVIEYLEQDGIVHSLDLYTEAKGEFIEYFEEKILKPKGYNYKIMFAGPTGSNAMEAAIKLARKVTGRTNIFSLMGGFHGMTLGALAMTTDAGARKGAGVPLENVTHIPAPYMYPGFDTIQYMEDLITDDHSGVEIPAALVVEPMQAEGGINIMPDEWMQQASRLCSRHGILLIMDEIQVGNCRTGPFFCHEHAGIRPDIITLAKSIGGMGMPMALTLFKPELDKWVPGEHNGTFRGFQLATVAGKAGLEFMQKHRIEDEVRRKGKIVEEFLQTELPQISDKLIWRGRGLMWGIDMTAYPEGTAKTVSGVCFKNGLIAELAGRKDGVLKIMPPLTIEDDLLLKGLQIIMESIRSCGVI